MSALGTGGRTVRDAGISQKKRIKIHVFFYPPLIKKIVLMVLKIIDELWSKNLTLQLKKKLII